MVEWGREHFEGNTSVALFEGTLVFLQQVGRNSTHVFYIGQSQDGRAFKVTGGEESVKLNELRVDEQSTYLGDCEFWVWRKYIRELQNLCGYWGHA